MMKLCECGCGQVVKKRFVSGHSSRVRKLSAEHKKHISEGLQKRRKSCKSYIEPTTKTCECGCGETFIAKKYWKNGVFVEKKFVAGHSSKRESSRERFRNNIKNYNQKRKTLPKYTKMHIKNKYGISLIRGRYLISCRDGSQIMYAQAVMENKIGRLLRVKEVVHHINVIKDDDRVENLMLFQSTSEHTKWHWDHDWKSRRRH